MNVKVSILLIAVAAALAGCNEPNTTAQTKTVAWFLDHRDELAVALKACGENPGEFAGTPNCINANEARNKIIIQEIDDALK